MRAVVQPVETRPKISPGGLSAGMTHWFQVSQTDGDAVAGGAQAVRGALHGVVITKEHFSGGWGWADPARFAHFPKRAR